MKKRRVDAARAFQRKQDIFKNGVVNIDRGGLKFAADAQPVDLIFVELGQVGVRAKFDSSRCPAGCGR